MKEGRSGAFNSALFVFGIICTIGGPTRRNYGVSLVVLQRMRSLVLSLLAATMSMSILAAQEPHPPDSAPATFGTTVVLPAGLHGIVYFIPKNTTVLPDFGRDIVQRVGDIWTDTLNLPPRHWRSGFPGLTTRSEWFAIDYQGRFWIEKPGRYTFALISDDGSRLFLDDTPVIDNDCQHPPDLRLTAVKLDGGGHRIRISYFQGPRDCLALVLAVAGPDQPWRVFNIKEFRPPSNPEDWHYSAINSVTILPTTPEESSLSMDHLLQQLPNADPNEKLGIKLKAGNGCLAPPIRSCSR